jgi:hypothetical protein
VAQVFFILFCVTEFSLSVRIRMKICPEKGAQGMEKFAASIEIKTGHVRLVDTVLTGVFNLKLQ